MKTKLMININDKQTLPGNHWKMLLRISLKRTVIGNLFLANADTWKKHTF